ncbi:MAG: VWA domain-containing protein [Phycisphaerales bacterium JB039]
MTWGAPLIAGIAAAIAIPSLLILYFLKLRRRDVEISSTLLWKKAIEDLQANAPFQKLRRNILLLLQLLVLAAAIFAIAQPQLLGAPVPGSRHVILLDRSASMRALDGLNANEEPGATRLEQARREALALIESLSAPSALPWRQQKADEAMVVAFGASGEVLQPFTTDKSRLRAAVESITPTDAPSSITEAMRLVRAQAPSRSFVDDTTGRIVDLPPGSVGTIHIFSDGRIEGAAEVDLHPDDILRYYRTGAPETPNIAITGLRAGRDLKDPDQLSIFVGLQSTARQSRTVDVELLINGVSTAVRSALLDAAEIQTTVTDADTVVETLAPATGGVVFETRRPEGAFVTVALRRADGAAEPLDDLIVDDVAWIVAPPAKRLAIALVMPPAGNLFLREAVSGLPIASLRILTPDEYEALAARAETGQFDVIIFDRWLPQAPGGRR